MIERACIPSPDKELMVQRFLLSLDRTVDMRPQRLADAERRHILSVLEDCGGTVNGVGNTADRLGINPSTLRSRMKKLGIKRPARSRRTT